jgi:hypothetical protein
VHVQFIHGCTQQAIRSSWRVHEEGERGQAQSHRRSSSYIDSSYNMIRRTPQVLQVTSVPHQTLV